MLFSWEVLSRAVRVAPRLGSHCTGRKGLAAAGCTLERDSFPPRRVWYSDRRCDPAWLCRNPMSFALEKCLQLKDKTKYRIAKGEGKRLQMMGKI